MKNLTIFVFAIFLTSCGTSESVPFWANGYKPGEFVQIKNLLMNLPGWTVDLEKGKLTSKGYSFDLCDFAEICFYLDPGEWEALVHKWIEDGKEADDLLGADCANFEKIAPYLMLRLVATNSKGAQGEMISRVDLPETKTVLALQKGRFLRNIRQADLAFWGQAIPKLFELAATNTAAFLKSQIQITKEQVIPNMVDAVYFQISASTPILGSLILVPNVFSNYEPLSPGVWGVPHSRTLFYTPLKNVSGLAASSFLADAVIRNFDERPVLISSNLYLSREKQNGMVYYQVLFCSKESGKPADPRFPNEIVESIRASTK